MNPIIVVSHDPAAGQNWWERTHVNPRSHQMPDRGSGHSKSPGCIRTLSRRPSFSRRQAVGVVAYLNTSTLTAVQFVRGVFRALGTRLSSLVNCVQQPTSGFAQTLKSFLRFAVLVHDEKLAEGVSPCPVKAFPSSEKEFPRES